MCFGGYNSAMNTIRLPSFSNVLRSLVATLAAGYALAFVVLQLAFASPFQDTDLLRLINTLGLWLYLPLPFLLLVAVALRTRASLLLLVPLAWFAVEYGSLFMPRTASQQGLALQVMTWNVLFKNRDVAGVTGAIRAEQPDIVTLQELGPALSAGLSRELQAEYPYMLLKPQLNTTGLGILSRFPLEQVPPYTDPTGDCRCQHVWVRIGEQRIEIVNVHPSVPQISSTIVGRRHVPIALNTTRHERTIGLVLDRVEKRHGPLLLMGDFNMTDRQPAYQRVRGLLGDAYRDGGWGFGLTYPNARGVGRIRLPPIIRIDYVFYSPEWSVLSAWNGARPSSDHRYLVSRLVLPQ
jgi:endonuclease/exonuclease/phosphatase (EEP) superfamily protein YafD